MESLNILSQGGSTISNKIIRKKIGVLPSLILAEMVCLSELANGDWFPMEWDYLREEFEIKGKSALKTSISKIIDLGLFETQIFNRGNGSRTHYRIKVNFGEWFETISGIQLVPICNNLIEPVIDEILPQKTIETSVIDEKLEENFSNYPMGICIDVNSNCNKKNAAKSSTITFLQFYERSGQKLSKFIAEENISYNEAIRKIDQYYNRMTYKNKRRPEDEWFNMLCRYIKTYLTPTELSHTGLKPQNTNDEYFAWVKELANLKRRQG